MRFRDFLIESEGSDYIYHATNHYNAHDIHSEGKLKTHKPWHGTDQSSWPDGSTEKRSYWGHDEKHVAPFHPEEGKPAILRAKKSIVNPKTESYTKDLYTTKPVPSKHLEIHHEGSWKPLHKAFE